MCRWIFLDQTEHDVDVSPFDVLDKLDKQFPFDRWMLTAEFFFSRVNYFGSNCRCGAVIIAVQLKVNMCSNHLFIKNEHCEHSVWTLLQHKTRQGLLRLIIWSEFWFLVDSFVRSIGRSVFNFWLEATTVVGCCIIYKFQCTKWTKHNQYSHWKKFGF